MPEEIVNRVANSNLVTFDLETLYPKGKRVVLDIKQWLQDGMVLYEKPFREDLKNYNWATYKDSYVALTCSTNAIIPDWAFMLITVYLSNHAKYIHLGTLESLDIAIYQKALSKITWSTFANKAVIIKGCSNKPVPKSAFLEVIIQLKPYAKSIMYGEACSAVPLYKHR